jgi:hypothetical protein
MNNKKGCAMPIYLACAGKDEKYHQYYCYVHFIEGFAWATDGGIMVKQSLKYYDINNTENLDNKMIHKDYFKEICRYKAAEATKEGIKVFDGERTAFFPFEHEVTFFNFPEKTKDFNFDNVETDYVDVIPKYIDIASKILFTNSFDMRLTLEFRGNFLKMKSDYNDQMAICNLRITESRYK